jgi:IS30 family transposase
MPYKSVVHTITTDNGTEFAEHERIAKKLDAKIYFAHPYSSWEKGLVENTNKLIRQYIPKRSVLRDFSDEFIHSVQLKLNRRPREKLNFDAPKNKFFVYLH